MESTLKDIKSKTYGIVTDPTYISYSLIGFTTLILGYYVFYDKNSSPKSEVTADESEAPAMNEASMPSLPSLPSLPSMFGTSEVSTEGESSQPSQPSESSMFGTSEVSKEEKVPTEEKVVGGKKKKTRRERKQLRKHNKSAKHAKKKN